jgi:GT2 family glycosyltransferase
MKLSILIPAYNHAQDVMRCLQSMLATTDRTRTEVLIQDDASPEYHGPTLFGALCERNPVNLGFPGNCNAGARRARGDVLLLLNQDTFTTQQGWDARLLDFFELTPDAGVAGPTLLFPDGRVQSVGGEFDLACQPYHIALGAVNPDWEPINTPRQVPWITGAAFAVRRSCWEQLGGFDEGYRGGYFEDVDFCVRAQLQGWQVWHRPNIRFTHYVGSTGGNPHVRANALRFKARWVDTRIVTPDSTYLQERFWV